jgi:hypothetical protein
VEHSAQEYAFSGLHRVDRYMGTTALYSTVVVDEITKYVMYDWPAERLRELRTLQSTKKKGDEVTFLRIKC